MSAVTNNPLIRDYNVRILAYLAGAVTIASGSYTGHLAHSILWVIPYALLYPHITYLVCQRFFQYANKASRRTLHYLDTINTGIVIGLVGFSAVPTILFILMLEFSTIAFSGRQTLSTTNLFLIASAMAGYILGGGQLAGPTPTLMAVAAGISSGVYILYIAYQFHHTGEQLKTSKKEIQLQKEKSLQLANNLCKYVSPQVYEMIFAGRHKVRLETQRKKLSVFFSDIKGFTELTEEMEAEALTDLLNNYLTEMSNIALKYGGTIDKFVGDSIMVFFGDPTSQGAKKDAMSAVSMAIAMRKHMKVLRQQWRSQGISKPLEIRMGVNTGYCTVGNFGAESRMDYTIIGKEVNLASRLESSAEPNEILISYETYSLIKDIIMCRDKGNISVKGFSRPIAIYQVVDFRRDLGATQSFIEHELEGFSMYLDTANVQRYDKEKIIAALQDAAKKLRDKVII
ncbi:adenylate/guanylate cyclase domain-containing protein [Spartinivicinus poritis]|uniref:Adenylate cyclase n=1 Tax=Spartinivicinus poritis TaxID=2994640 RepID=A0ABT5UE03_9GAMM|nr:adenylate/guanylate cyclase domain-containing protein [Spartinivicinus sp. A2-2]MDE1464588.1 adenylate cyclase [Spartinivicinus sp. A2-2]